MSMAVGGGRGNAIADINVTPMVDIMLVILIIFMVITPLLQKGVSVDLAKTKNPREMREADRDDAVVVAVTRDAKIWLNADQITAKDQLGPKIQDVLASEGGQDRLHQERPASQVWRGRRCRGHCARCWRGHTRTADHPCRGSGRRGVNNRLWRILHHVYENRG